MSDCVVNRDILSHWQTKQDRVVKCREYFQKKLSPKLEKKKHFFRVFRLKCRYYAFNL